MTKVALAGDLEQAIELVPGQAGVGKLLGPEDKVLVVGRASSLRSWVRKNLGGGRPARKGGRPPLDLRPLAREVAFETTTSQFHQRLVYERQMANVVPTARRRDLRPPVFLHLDPSERFPRVSLRVGVPAGELGQHYGPFRDKRQAVRALSALHKSHPLRPCDFFFEPDPGLPLGLGCVYAQVRSCAAPCLERVSEAAYRELAVGAAARLAGGSGDWPEWIASGESRGVVAERGVGGIEAYPVLRGVVVESQRSSGSSLDLALAGLRFDAPRGPAGEDWPWLLAWLATPRRRGAYVTIDPRDETGSWRRVLASRLADEGVVT